MYRLPAFMLLIRNQEQKGTVFVSLLGMLRLPAMAGPANKDGGRASANWEYAKAGLENASWKQRRERGVRWV